MNARAVLITLGIIVLVLVTLWLLGHPLRIS